MTDSSLAVVTCYFNPCGYRNRERCFERFAKAASKQGVSLWVFEAVLPGQKHFVPDDPQVRRVQLSAKDWIWQKERLLNLLIAELPPHIDKVAWVDCDLLFHNDNWVAMAAQSLATWPVVQLFDFAYWLGPNDERLDWDGIANRRASLGSIAIHYPDRARDFRIGSPGFAWAARREIIAQCGLYENDITGNGDLIIATALYGWKDFSLLSHGNAAVQQDCENYIDRVHSLVRGYVGYIPCGISHLWHGAMKDRAYLDRKKRVSELGFDPFRDLEYDPETKLLCWSEYASDALKEYVRGYFFSRNEDAAV